MSHSELSAVNSAQAKLQAFVSSLTTDEAAVVEQMVARAADESLTEEQAGAIFDPDEDRSIIIVSGRGIWHRVLVNPVPGELDWLNPQPLPPEPPPDIIRDLP